MAVLNPSNRLLASLPAEDYGIILDDLRPVHLAAEFVLHEPGSFPEYAFFPDDAAVLIGTGRIGSNLVGSVVIGDEGIIGGFSVLDGEPEHSRTLVLIAGEASLISIYDLQKAAQRSAAIRTMLFRSQRFLLSQAQQAAACNASHTLTQRLATWFLRLRNASHKRVLTITQERIGELLAVRRTSVCLAAHAMQQARMIKVWRGNIEIMDDSALETESCGCWRLIEPSSKQVFGGVRASSERS